MTRPSTRHNEANVDVILAAIWAARRDGMMGGAEQPLKLRIGTDIRELLLASPNLARHGDFQLRLAQTGQADLGGAHVVHTAQVDPRVWELRTGDTVVSTGAVETQNLTVA